jgi:integrase
MVAPKVIHRRVLYRRGSNRRADAGRRRNGRQSAASARPRASLSTTARGGVDSRSTSRSPCRQSRKTEVRAWHQAWRPAGPCAANRAALLLSTLFNYAIKKTDPDLLSNPCAAIDLFPERLKREVLPFDQLPASWAAVNVLPNSSHAAYWKLLLFTGLRRNDAASIKLSEIRAHHIFRPNPKGGAAKAFPVPMTLQLHAIVEEALTAWETLRGSVSHLTL